MINLTSSDAALLNALATYRLLTIQQATRVSFVKIDQVRERLRVLIRARLVKVLKQQKMAGPYIHWLTKSGVELANELAVERGEAGAFVAAARDYVLGPHLRQRLTIVDCHIALRSWAATTGAAIEWFRVEFEPNPQGELKKSLQFPWEWQGQQVTYAPDAAGVIKLPEGTLWLFALEVETGGEAQSLGNFKKHLAERLAAFQARALEGGVEWPQGERVGRLLFVFLALEMMKQAQEWAVAHHGETLRFVFFATVENLEKDFASEWQSASGKTALPFSKQ